MRANSWRYIRVRVVFFVLSAVLAVCFAAQSCEALSDAEMALTLAEKMGAQFEPESMTVRVSSSRAFVEARGIYLNGVRIERMNIEAILTSSEVPEGEDINVLASLIAYSWGEIELLADDINEYFTANEVRGFSNLAVRFSPNGFYADVIFVRSLLFTFRIRLSATGRFGLRTEGVFIEDPAIYIEGIRQPGFLVNEIMERANPLIEWSAIPFRVVFREIIMTEYSTVMTGRPGDFTGGVVASWNGAQGEAYLR